MGSTNISYLGATITGAIKNGCPSPSDYAEEAPSVSADFLQSGGYMILRKYGYQVFLLMFDLVKTTASSSETSRTIATLPTNWRPKHSINSLCMALNATDGTLVSTKRLNINGNGDVNLYGTFGSTTVYLQPVAVSWYTNNRLA